MIATVSPTSTDENYEWWSVLKHGGLLVAPSKLPEFFDRTLPPLPGYVEDRLRRDVTQCDRSDRDRFNRLCDTVLEDVLSLSKTQWIKAVDNSWTQRAITGEAIKPKRVWVHPEGMVLPLFEAEASRLGIGKGRREVSRVVEWLRKAEYKIALLTNGRQWRLIHAGVDYDAWCEWDIDLWFEEGKPGLQVAALRLLLGRDSLEPPQPNAPCPLIQAIQASRQVQAELSGDLGERVRKAVELLIRETGVESGENIANREIYIAANRVIMRCVVILFAEARNLLPRENPIYHESYGIQGLRELLTRQAGGRAGERLRNSFSAWPRLLSLFRLVYSGSAHPELIVPRYGGKLFVPGDSLSSDPIARALAIFENPANSPSDAMVYRMLELLTRSKVKVRQGRRSTWVEAPVDFSGLSSEYIGILYEGLLDFELRQVAADNPIVFLNLGDRPALPLQRLEEMDDKALKALVEKLKQKAKPSTSEDEEESDDDAEAEAEESEAEASEEEEDSDTDTEADAEEGDRTLELRQRATNWAIRAVKVGSLVTKPKSKKREALADYETAVETMAKRLILEVLLPGESFLVRWGGTRKGSGTFYTRPQLAVPTVRRTLLPLAYNPPVDEAGNPDREVPAAQWHPKTPQEILDVKVCDPACGSGSFLIAALGFLTDALYESLFYHGWLTEDPITQQVRVAIAADAIPQWFAECVKDLPVTLDYPGEETSFSRHKLKRYVVERCIYGVDIDALAVELARLSLWVETMDKSLPFSFLDHKVKCGNSLVGCWFDQFQDYPVMAWERDAGDANHDKFVHHYREYVAKSGKKKGQAQQKGDKWTQGIKETRNSRVKDELKALLETLDLSKPIISNFETSFPLPKLPEAIHDEAVGIFQEWHNLPIDYDSEEKKENEYEEKFRQDKAIQQLKQAFDSWCAVWFWPGDELEIAPTPQHFFDPTPEMAQRVAELAQQYQFFHWELEFPDVFAGVNDGFTAIVGNPPWEIQKPNSMEFFSNIDPLYRTYGKQEALAKQVEYFQSDPQIEKSWLLYCDKLKALSNWTKNVGFPFGDPEEDGGKFSLSRSPKETELLHDLWRQRRQQHIGYADKRHPFRYQGSADINTYKLFLELSLVLLRQEGRMGMIVPSGIYTDKGSTTLRSQFLQECDWQWLFAFENREKIFPDVDTRFKFCPVIVQKGGKTEAIFATFMQRSLEAWEEAEKHVLAYPRRRVEQFSPNSKAILEIKSDRDLAILEKMYDNGVLLGDDSPEGWGIQYATEFHMTNDSKLFPPRPQWEVKGYRADEYGHWLKGNWQPYHGSPSILQRPEGLILSVDGTSAIHVDEVEDVALPLYQGIMIQQFDFSPKGWISGTGVRAIWEEITWEHKSIRPQYLITAKDAYGKPRMIRGTKPSVRRVARNTDYRTTICGLVPDMPCGDKASIFAPIQHIATLALPAYLNSYAFDSVVRSRVGGTQLDYHIAAEIPTACGSASENNQLLAIKVLQLNGAYTLFAEDWIKLRTKFANTHKTIDRSWYQLWAITPHERLRLRCILDAVVAELYGLDIEDFTWILRDCDYPAAQVCDNAFARTLEPKGFWRVDKDKDPELRHTVLSLIALHELKRLGLEPFLNLNDGEGWMLPETVRLADYGLGHDPRATEPQPVAARLGDRFLPWQLEGTIEDSWQECERHADNLRRLLGDTPQTFNQKSHPAKETRDTPRKTDKLPSDPDYVPPTDRFGNPLNVDLFGNIIEGKSKRKKQ